MRRNIIGTVSTITGSQSGLIDIKVNDNTVERELKVYDNGGSLHSFHFNVVHLSLVFGVIIERRNQVFLLSSGSSPDIRVGLLMEYTVLLRSNHKQGCMR